jgi:hypothetical protein
MRTWAIVAAAALLLLTQSVLAADFARAWLTAYRAR